MYDVIIIGAGPAGISAGMFVSILSGATPLTEESWGLSNQMTSKALEAISRTAISANIEITLSQGKAEFCCSTAITSLSSNSSIGTLLNSA